MIQTVSAYGYNLGGPGAWNLFKFNAGDELRTSWFDETDPTHNFAACATAAVAATLRLPSAEQSSLDVPFTFVEALEVSPPGWNRETSAPPPPTHLLPATSDLLSLNRVAVARFVLVIGDSQFDRDEENAALHRDDGSTALDPAVYMTGDPDLDWDGVLIAALTTLGLEPVGMPDWLWYRGSRTNH